MDNFKGHQMVIVTENSHNISNKFVIDTTEFKLYNVKTNGDKVEKYKLKAEFMYDEKNKKMHIIKYGSIPKKIINSALNIIEDKFRKVYKANE